LLTPPGFALSTDAFDSRCTRRRRRVVEDIPEFQGAPGGELTITLLEGVGRGVEVHAIDANLVEQSIRWLRARTG